MTTYTEPLTKAKADNLFDLGYRARPHKLLHCVLVVKPNGDAYRLNLIERTCTCRGFTSHGRCKHVRQVGSLIRSCWNEVPFWLSVDEHRAHEAAMEGLMQVLDEVEESQARFSMKA